VLCGLVLGSVGERRAEMSRERGEDVGLTEFDSTFNSHSNIFDITK